MSTEAVNSKEPWLTFFDKEYFCCEKGTVEHDVASILKNMLLSTDVNNAAHTAAYQLNTYYWERNNESGPFFQWGNEKEPFPDFISFLYDIIVRVTPFLSYNDASQNVIVQLVLELRNLPPNSVKAWNGDRLVSLDETLFAELLDETWIATFASDDRRTTAASSSEWKEQCDNKYPRIDIADGLDDYINPGVKRDSRVMIAAQYILLAGSVLDEEFIQNPKACSTGVVKWQSWARRFKELVEMELASEVKAAVIEARKKMISLRPELFSVSEGGSRQN